MRILGLPNDNHPLATGDSGSFSDIVSGINRWERGGGLKVVELDVGNRLSGLSYFRTVFPIERSSARAPGSVEPATFTRTRFRVWLRSTVQVLTSRSSAPVRVCGNSASSFLCLFISDRVVTVSYVPVAASAGARIWCTTHIHAVTLVSHTRQENTVHGRRQ